MIGEICKYKSHIYYNNICIVTVTFNGEDYIIYKSGDFTCNCNDTFYLFIDNYDKLNIINVQNFFESRVNIFYVSKGYTFYEGNRYRCNYSGDGFIIVEDFEKTTYKIKFKGRFKKMSKAESQWDGEFQFNTKFLSDGLRDFGHALKASGSYAGDSFIRISKLDEATLEKLRPFFEDIEEHLELAYNFMELKEGNEYPNGDEYLEQVALALEDAITGSDNSVFILEY